jgi:hypothetical protein
MTATKERRSPDRRFEFSAKGAVQNESATGRIRRGEPGANPQDWYGKGKPGSAESAIQLPP